MSALPKVWCIGLGRTGTTSLFAALKILGYTRVRQNPVFEELPTLDAATDAGCVVFYKYLDWRFPGSRFILTLRDLDAWLPSIRAVFDANPCGTEDDVPAQRRMLIYETVGFDRDKMIAGYQRHHADVARYFAGRERDLLRLRICDGDGWETLCPFLGLPVPGEPFPHRNRRHELGGERGGALRPAAPAVAG